MASDVQEAGMQARMREVCVCVADKAVLLPPGPALACFTPPPPPLPLDPASSVPSAELEQFLLVMSHFPLPITSVNCNVCKQRKLSINAQEIGY